MQELHRPSIPLCFSFSALVPPIQVLKEEGEVCSLWSSKGSHVSDRNVSFSPIGGVQLIENRAHGLDFRHSDVISSGTALERISIQKKHQAPQEAN